MADRHKVMVEGLSAMADHQRVQLSPFSKRISCLPIQSLNRGTQDVDDLVDCGRWGESSASLCRLYGDPRNLRNDADRRGVGRV